jgi:hypothetical protein
MLLQTAFVFRFAQDQCKAMTNQQEHAITPSDFCSKPHGRAILTDEQAQQIFRYKPAPEDKTRKRAAALSKIYGVSVKTIRDIWSGRTWYRATCHLDQSKPLAPERLQKKAGRPKGAKDSKPRAKKSPNDFMDSSISLTKPVDHLDKQNEIVEQRRAMIAERSETQEADGQATSVACDEETHLSIGPDFPGDLSTRPFQDPFDKNLSCGLWDEV